MSNLPPEFDSWLRPEDSSDGQGAKAGSAPSEQQTRTTRQPVIPAPDNDAPAIAGPVPRAVVPAPAAVAGQTSAPRATPAAVIPAPAATRPAATRPAPQAAVPTPSPPATAAPAHYPPAQYPPVHYSPAPAAPTRNRRKRRPLRWIALGLAAYLAAVTATFMLSVNRIDAMPAQSSASSRGMNVLMIGSDSRAGLTPEQQNALTTGSVEGNRTDTIMLLHIPLIGSPTLVSIPRDSWVPIPGYGSDKINAAYALGGPQLLISTVEQATGLQIDDFVEIGLAGIANTTDALGGVRLCPAQAYSDELSGLNVTAGCQLMDGPTSLAYVRMRYADPRGDLGRVERQQEYISATVKRAMSPLTWLLPWRSFGAARAAGESLTVSKGTHIWDLGRIGVALGMISMGWGTSTTVPTVEGSLEVAGQSALAWDTPAAQALFADLS